MSSLIVRIPKSRSKRLEQAVTLAKEFNGFEQLDDCYKIRPHISDIQTSSFKQLVKIIKNWVGTEFHEDGWLRTAEVFSSIGCRVGDAIAKTAPENWIKGEWLEWEERPDDILDTHGEIVDHFLPKTVESEVAIFPIEVEISLKSKQADSKSLQVLEAKVDSLLVGYVKHSLTKEVLNRVPDFKPMRFPAVLVKGRILQDCYLWGSRPISDGVRLVDPRFAEEAEARWWTHDPTYHYNFALWTLKFPRKKEPFDRFPERILADLEGRKLEPLPESIRQRERRKQKRAEAKRKEKETMPSEPEGCGKQVAALIALAWLLHAI